MIRHLLDIKQRETFLSYRNSTIDSFVRVIILGLDILLQGVLIMVEHDLFIQQVFQLLRAQVMLVEFEVKCI